MNFLGNASVARKLWVSTGLIIVSLAGAGVYMQRSATNALETAALQVQRYENAITVATEWKGLTLTNLTRSVAATISIDPNVIKVFSDALKKSVPQSNGLQKQISEIATGEADKKALQDSVDKRSVVLALTVKAYEINKTGDQAAAQEYVQKTIQPAIDQLLASQDAFIELQISQREGAKAAAASARARAEATGIAVMLAVSLLGLGFTMLLVRAICRPLAQAVDLSTAIASGDLTRHVDSDRRDELGQLLRAMNAMVNQLRTVVGDVRSGVESVSTASGEIASGNQDLSQRTEEQASALQQTSATMDELGTTIRNNADNARQANQLALGASSVAAKGGEVVGQVVGTMKGINDSSKKIADIIGVIDGIAFQTNILALNAAVEAARAGEQGRGFAVVASEVRNLAKRSADAAKEIKSLITGSVEQVERGTVLVGQAGSTMEEIVVAIQRVSDIVAEISSASAEQSAGVSQVGDAVNQMDQVTQQNAALVEESAAAAESLRVQAQQLVSAVAVFKLSGAHASAVVAPTAAPSAKPDHRSEPVNAERRGPNRAKNVTRPAFGKKSASTAKADHSLAPAKTGTDDWEAF